MNLPYDSCALWLIFGEFFEETRFGEIARRGDGRRQCEYHYEDRERWPWRASWACHCSSVLSLSCMLLYVRYAEPATYLGSGCGNLSQVHESLL